MSGETFEFAAAVAGVSIGLAALLLMSFVAIAGVWRLFGRIGETSDAATRAALAAEELSRRQAIAPAARAAAGSEELVELSRQTEALIQQQARLEETARRVLETTGQDGEGRVRLDDVESAIIRLDGTVGQMAASITSLVKLLERQQRG